MTLYLVALFLLGLSLIGLIIPVFPGVPVMFLIALVYGFVEGFSRLHGLELAVLAGLAGISVIIDYSSGILGARFGGAGKKALGMGFIGTIIGTIVIPPFGGFLGLFIGVAAVEWRERKNIMHALKAGSGGLLGSLAGMAINLLIGLAFVVIFALFAWR